MCYFRFRPPSLALFSVGPRMFSSFEQLQTFLFNPLIGCDFLALLIGFVQVQSRAVFDWPWLLQPYQIKLRERPCENQEPYPRLSGLFFFHLFTSFNLRRIHALLLVFRPHLFYSHACSLTRLHTVLIIATGLNPEVT